MVAALTVCRFLDESAIFSLAPGLYRPGFAATGNPLLRKFVLGASA